MLKRPDNHEPEAVTPPRRNIFAPSPEASSPTPSPTTGVFDAAAASRPGVPVAADGSFGVRVASFMGAGMPLRWGWGARALAGLSAACVLGVLLASPAPREATVSPPAVRPIHAAPAEPRGERPLSRPSTRTSRSGSRSAHRQPRRARQPRQSSHPAAAAKPRPVSPRPTQHAQSRPAAPQRAAVPSKRPARVPAGSLPEFP